MFLVANIGWQIVWQSTGALLPRWGQRIGNAGFNDEGIGAGTAAFPDGQQHGVVLVPVEFTKIWETQNKANQIHNPTRKDDPWGGDGYGGYGTEQNGAPRNKLFLVPDPQSNKYKATIEVDLPEAFRAKIFAAAYVGDTKIADSDKAFNSDGRCELEFEHLGTSNDIEDFAIRIGYDANNSGTLDPGEITKLAVKTHGEPMVRGTRNSKYDSSKSTVDNVVDGFVVGDWVGLTPHARNFLRTFRDGGLGGPSFPDDKKPTSSLDVSLEPWGGYFAEWLTHNSGAPFSDEGVATIKEYVWDDQTSSANALV